MHNQSRRDLITRLRELEFAAVELNLYLDNHPTDEQALCDYNSISRELMNVKNMYEANYAPLSNFGTAQSQHTWKYVEEPWPWETGE